MRRVSIVAAAVLLFAGMQDAGAQTNLVANHSAEDGGASTGGSDVVPIPQWDVTGNMTAIEYGNNGFPASGSAYGGGGKLFVGGPDNAESRAEQMVDLTDHAQLIDSGRAAFEISAALGGFQDQKDYALVDLAFMDADGEQLDAVRLPPVEAEDRDLETKLLLRTKTGKVPVDTSFAVVVIIAVRVSGGYNDGYADVVNLTINEGNFSETEVAFDVVKTERRLIVKGRVQPTFEEGEVTVFLWRADESGKLVVIDKKRREVDFEGRFKVEFRRPAPGRCKVHARFVPSDEFSSPSRARKLGRC